MAILLALAAVSVVSSADACRVALSPQDRLELGYRGAISAVALVRVIDANYTALASSDSHPWRASAVVERFFRGDNLARTVHFERGFGSSSCDDGRPIAKVGNLWVVYFWKRTEGDQRVWLSYPADVAYAVDPHLK